MERNFFIIITMCLGMFLNGQKGKVGINTSNPKETLDVNGKSYINSLYLRNPGEPTMSGGSFLATSENAMQLYDPTLESAGLFNYLKITLNGVPGTGITDYDTKINTDNFLLVLYNYSFYVDADRETDVMLDYGDNGTNDNRQGSPDVVAFKKNGTWHLKALFTNSRIISSKQGTAPSRTYNNFNVNLFLMAYRRLITKQNITDVNANLGGTDGSTQTINKPAGF